MPDLQFKLDPDSEPDPRLLALLSGLIGKDNSTASKIIDVVVNLSQPENLLSLYKRLPLSRVDYSKEREQPARNPRRYILVYLINSRQRVLIHALSLVVGKLDFAQNHYDINKENIIGIDGEWQKNFNLKYTFLC